MKTILILLLGFSSYGQTKFEALQFLRENVGIWSTEQYAEGTFKTRLEFSLEDSFLVVKETMPSSSFSEYGIIRIHLSSIKRVEAIDGYVIRITTLEGGLELVNKFRKSDSEIIIDPEDYANTYGWTYDGIRLKRNQDIERRIERVIKALEFLAEDDGAILSKSNF